LIILVFHGFIGSNTGYGITSGNSNTFIGAFSSGYSSGSGYSVTTGSYNAFIGVNNASTGGSGSSITTGNYNTIIGSYNGNQGGLDIRTSSYWTVISGGDGSVQAKFNPSSGSWYQQSNGANWATTSDKRIKENVQEIVGLDIITKLHPVSFDYIQTKKSDVGFIAQEYQTVLPEQITVTNDGLDEATKEVITDNKLLGIQQNLVPYLVKAIQELNTKVTALEAQLGAK
jgi:hypothetical protein